MQPGLVSRRIDTGVGKGDWELEDGPLATGERLLQKVSLADLLGGEDIVDLHVHLPQLRGHPTSGIVRSQVDHHVHADRSREIVSV